jgi:hypothetical protein
MSRLCVGTSVFLVIVSTAAAQTQQPGGVRISQVQGALGIGLAPTYYSRSLLLERPQVQEEVKLRPAQKKSLEAVDKKYEQAQKSLVKNAMAERVETGVRGDPKALYNASAALREEAETVRMRVLDRGQRSRLDQIQLQAEGAIAFKRDEIQRRLNLDPEQIDEIVTIVDQGNQEVYRVATAQVETSLASQPVDAARNRGPSRAPVPKEGVKKSREAATSVRGKAMQSIGKVLSKKQRENYTKMLGKPFDLGKLRPDPGAKPADAKEKPAASPSDAAKKSASK